MTVKEYLEELPNMRMRIRAMERKIQECKERASDTSAKLTDEHGSGGGNKITDNVDEAVDLEAKLKEMVKGFKRFELIVSEQIGKMPNSTYSGLLFNKYINGMTWEEVAAETDKGVDYVRKELHSKALAEFSKIYPDYPRFTPCILLENDYNGR